MAVAAVAKPKTVEELGLKGKVEKLQVDSLNVDHSYQRDLDMMRVQRYASTWDLVACGTILVSRRADGVLYVVNGQHRWAAAKMAQESRVNCFVVDGLTAQDEARLRLLTNDMKTDRPAERFRAQIASGDPRSIAINQIVQEAGTEINVGSANMASGLNAISALEFIYDRDDGLLLARTLAVLGDAFGRLNGETSGSAFMKGVAFLLERHPAPELDRSHLVERLKMAGPSQVKRLSLNYRAVHGGAGWLNVYRAVTELYNNKLSDARKLQWRTHGWVTTYGDSRNGRGKDRGGGL